MRWALKGCVMAAGLLLGLGAARAQVVTGFKATFPVEHKDISLSGAGVYSGGAVPVNLDSATASTILPNSTSTWKVQPNAGTPTKGVVMFRDSEPGLKLNPGNTNEPISRLKGSIAAVASVNQVIGDVHITVTVNPAGQNGVQSRQGPMIRWDGKNRFLTCFVDFATGTAYFWAARTAYSFQELGTQKVTNFANTKPYQVDLTMVGQVAHCRVLDGGAVVADTGDVTDAQTPPSGATGVMFELSLTKMDVPLEGSFTELSATSTTGASIKQPRR